MDMRAPPCTSEPEAGLSGWREMGSPCSQAVPTCAFSEPVLLVPRDGGSGILQGRGRAERGEGETGRAEQGQNHGRAETQASAQMPAVGGWAPMGHLSTDLTRMDVVGRGEGAVCST